MEHSDVSVEVEKICGEIREGEEEVARIKRKRAESQAHCRGLMAQIKVRSKRCVPYLETILPLWAESLVTVVSH